MTLVFNIMVGRGRGGLERAAAHYHRALASHEYRAVTVGHPQGWLHTQLPAGAEFVPLAPFTDYDFRAHFALQRAVKKYEPSAVFAHGNRAIRYASRLTGVLRIGVLHNVRFKSATSGMDACIAVTDALVASAQQRYPGMPIEMVPNLVDFVSDSVRPQRRKPLVIGALGRLHVDKGFDFLIEALADGRLRDLDWRLVIGGEGPEQAYLGALAARKGLSERVSFAGWVEDRRAFFQSVDMLCMPSRVESFGMVLIEALAHGVPTIASDTSGSRQIVLPGKDALVVPVGDVDALARAIAKLIDDSAFAETLGRSGRETVSSRYSFPTVAKGLDRVVCQLVGSLARKTEPGLPSSRHV